MHEVCLHRSFFSTMRLLTPQGSHTSSNPPRIKTALPLAGPASCREPSCVFTSFLWQSHWNTCFLLFRNLLFGGAWSLCVRYWGVLVHRGLCYPVLWEGQLFTLAGGSQSASAPGWSPGLDLPGASLSSLGAMLLFWLFPEAWNLGTQGSWCSSVLLLAFINYTTSWKRPSPREGSEVGLCDAGSKAIWSKRALHSGWLYSCTYNGSFNFSENVP